MAPLYIIHHRKDFETYKVLSPTCEVSINELERCKEYIRDGEEALERAWKIGDLTKAAHLRCVKHLERNCKQKLHEIGIRERKKQTSFWRRYLVVPDKSEGTVKSEDKSDVKQRLDSCKDALDKRKIEVLQKKNDYQPKF